MPPAVLPAVATAIAGKYRSGRSMSTANSIASDDTGASVAAMRLPRSRDQSDAAAVKKASIADNTACIQPPLWGYNTPLGKG